MVETKAINGGRRDRFKILLDILEYCRTPRMQNYIIGNVQLSWAQTKRYVPALVKKGYLVMSGPAGRGCLYTTSTMGLTVLKKIERVSRIRKELWAATADV